MCDLVACKLPPENWWENGGGRGSNNSSGGGGGRGLQRQGSRGRRNAQEVAAVAELVDAQDDADY